MKRIALGLVVMLSLVTAAPLGARPVPQAGASRTIYVSVMDKDGKPVPGLTAADFKVKDGKDATVTKVEASTKRMKLAVLMEEALSPDTVTRQAILDFSKRMVKVADIAIIAAGIKNTIVCDYTSDLQKILSGLNNVAVLQYRTGNHMAEGIYELAKTIKPSELDRPVIVALALEMPQETGEQPDKVLNDLRMSGALLEVVAVQFTQPTSGQLDPSTNMIDSSKVLGEGPKASGGRKIDIASSRAIPTALMQVASDLESQYALTYELPAGAKPTDRLSVSTTRKNVTLLAPSRAIAAK